MHKVFANSLLATALFVAGPLAHADALDGLEMDVIGAEEHPEEAARRIELPDPARPSAGEDDGGSEIPGRDTTSEARDRGAQFGQETAEEARERRGPPEGVGPPDDAGRPDDGNGNRPEDPGDGNQPDQPGGDRPESPGGNQPEAPAGEQPEPPDNGRPDGAGGGVPDGTGGADRATNEGRPSL
jgi:hypothetical protein